jgi:hypothetical protein
MNLSDLENQSLLLLAEEVDRHIFWIASSPIPVITNLLVVVTVIISKSLHNKSHFLILCHSSSEMLVALNYFAGGLYRYLFFYFNAPEVENEAICKIKSVPNFIFTGLSAHYLLALAIDRFLCLAAPIFYKTRRRSSYLLIITGIILSYNFITRMLGFLNTDPKRLYSFCDASNSFDLIYTLILRYEILFIAALVVVIYLTTIIFLRRKFREVNSKLDTNKNNEWRRQMELDVFKALATIGCFNGFTLLAAKIVDVMNTSTGRVVIPYATILFTYLNSGSHLVFYLYFNSGFRQDFLKMVRKVCKGKNNAVSFIQVQQ